MIIVCLLFLSCSSKKKLGTLITLVLQLFWIIFPGTVFLTKICELMNESLIFSREIRYKDKRWVRVLRWYVPMLSPVSLCNSPSRSLAFFLTSYSTSSLFLLSLITSLIFFCYKMLSVCYYTYPSFVCRISNVAEVSATLVLIVMPVLPAGLTIIGSVVRPSNSIPPLFFYLLLLPQNLLLLFPHILLSAPLPSRLIFSTLTHARTSHSFLYSAFLLCSAFGILLM